MNVEEELILKQPSDRRLGENSALPPGPPGAEFDTVEFDTKNPPVKAPVVEKESSTSERASKRRSPSPSATVRKRKSPSRGRRSPSSPVRSRGRRSPSPRRNRYRDYSPDRRSRYGGRRSPDRRRSPLRRGGGRGRYRGRGRSSSRSISRSPTPPRRVGGSGSGRWSPKKKPNSPSQQPPPNLPRQLPQPPPTTTQPPPQYGVMAPPPPQLYGEAYGPPPGYNQYGVPPPQSAFVQPNEAYVAMQAQSAGFSTAYPPPGSWGVDAYSQQQWLPPPTQIQQMPPPQQQQQPPPPPLVVQPTNQQQIPPNMPPPNSTSAAVTNKLGGNLVTDATGTLETSTQHDAVAQEAENQRDELKKQRTSYLKKTAVLKKELKMLKEQRKELHSGGVPASPTTKGFIDENEKLQNQIQKKLSTIENVIDMLTGIIGEENLDKEDQIEDDEILKEAALTSLQKPLKNEHGSSQIVHAAEAVPHKKKTRSSSSSSDSSSGSTTSSSSDSSSSDAEQPTNKDEEEDDSSPERLKKKVIESMRNKDKDARNKQDQKGPNRKERFNYVFYDPEMHWCQTCNVFPKTAKDYLNHLHTKNHMDRESIETPWHTDMVTDQFPTYENAPTKRTPIRGLTFFVPATAWFCKLCNIWMGDLHCASTHLKSQLHASRYNAFLEENPHYEVNWLADRQIVLNEQKTASLPQQITSVSTTAGERKKSKKDDDKTSKKRKKKSDKKQKKKKKKSTKKRKKESESSSSSSSESSSTTDSDEPKKKKVSAVEIKDLDNPNPGVSIRLSMRKHEAIKSDEVAPPPPPPQLKLKPPSPTSELPPSSKWTVVQEGLRNKDDEKPQDTDDSIIQQWNTVQPVISESEKKLLEQLKGKLKNKSKDEQQQTRSTTAQKSENDKENREREKDKDRERDKGAESRSERSDRRDKDTGNRGKDERDRDRDRDRERERARTSRRSRTRSPTRSRSRGRDYRRNVRRSRSRSRGRISPRGWRGRNRRIDRSRSRSLRRRSRSPYDRRRRNSRSRSNSRGGTSSRVEKPIVRQAEFRPRVPEKDKDKEKKSSDNKDKKEKTKPKTSSSSSSTTSTPANSAGKKLPFIGKMPVFKKQASCAPGEMSEKRPDEMQAQQAFMYPMDAAAAFSRPPAPTAAQIQMAMMEDAYGNAPPFHPDAGMMMDYDDLMPDPVQFVNIMGQAPPPPPPQSSDDDKDILPPGIDVEESEEFVPKPITEGPPPGKGPLPKDLEDALNIIFPGEKKPGEDEEGELEKTKVKGETQIINDEVVMQPEELAKDGIHLVTFEETSQLGLDDASQMSMNEPLVFNRPPSNPTTTAAITSTDMELEDANSQPRVDINIEIVPPPPPVAEEEIYLHEIKIPEEIDNSPTMPAPPDEAQEETKETNNMPEDTDDIPIPPELDTSSNTNTMKSSPKEEIAKEEKNEELMHPIIDIDLADIPQPPPSPTESEKNRRQEELDDLAMLGIDADDMAAQCM